MKSDPKNSVKKSGHPIGIVIGVILGIAIFLLPTAPFILQIIWILVLGWIDFLRKVIPYIGINKLMLLESIVIILILIAGVHWFLSWFYTNYNSESVNQNSPEEIKENNDNINLSLDNSSKLDINTTITTKSQWKLKWTITGISIFFLMFVISISITGLIHETSWLTKTPLTEYSFFYGGTTRKILQEMGLGLDLYYQEHKHLPIVSQPVPFKDLKIPKSYYNGVVIDQWGMPILYNSNGKYYTLRSYGKNKVLGGGTDEFDDLISINGQLLDTRNKLN